MGVITDAQDRLAAGSDKAPEQEPTAQREDVCVVVKRRLEELGTQLQDRLSGSTTVPRGLKLKEIVDTIEFLEIVEAKIGSLDFALESIDDPVLTNLSASLLTNTRLAVYEWRQERSRLKEGLNQDMDERWSRAGTPQPELPAEAGPKRYQPGATAQQQQQFGRQAAGLRAPPPVTAGSSTYQVPDGNQRSRAAWGDLNRDHYSSRGGPAVHPADRMEGKLYGSSNSFDKHWYKVQGNSGCNPLLSHSLATQDISLQLMGLMVRSHEQQRLATLLPMATPPKFGGNPMEFQGWRDYVRDTILYSPLPDVDKLRHVLATLVGDALQAVRHLPVCAGSLQLCLEMVTEEFGLPCLASKQFLKEIGKQKLLFITDYKGIAQFLRVLESAIPSLSEADVCSEVLLGTVLSKIPVTLRRRFMKYKSWRLKGADASLRDVVHWLKGEVALTREMEAYCSNPLEVERPPSAPVFNRNRRPPQAGAWAGKGFSPVHRGVTQLAAGGEEDGCYGDFGVEEWPEDEAQDLHCLQAAAGAGGFQKSSWRCPIHEGADHGPERCPGFLGMKAAERFQLIRSQNRCFVCLRGHWRGPDGKACAQVCGVDGCKFRHHPLLHNDSFRMKSDRPALMATEEDGAERVEEDSGGFGFTESSEGACMISTCKADVGQAADAQDASAWAAVDQGDCGTLSLVKLVVKCEGKREAVEVVAFLDSGSSCSWVSEKLVSRLGLPVSELCTTLVDGFHSKQPVRSGRVSLSVRGAHGGHWIALDRVRTRPPFRLGDSVVPGQEWCQHFPHLRDLSGFVDSMSYRDVQLLIGAKHGFHTIPMEGTLRMTVPEEPVAYQTNLGWIVYGPVCSGEVKGCNVALQAVQQCRCEHAELLKLQQAVQSEEDCCQKLESKGVALEGAECLKVQDSPIRWTLESRDADTKQAAGVLAGQDKKEPEEEESWLLQWQWISHCMLGIQS